MSNTSVQVPVLVLGAGLTGLSTAIELKRRGLDHALFERAPNVGGLAVTIEEQGFRFDRTGHLLHFRDDNRREKTLALLDEPPLSFERTSLIYSERVFTEYPYQSNTLGLPADTAYECVLGFIRAHFASNKELPRNFEEYCRTHFGDAISDRFMLPYNGRLWGVAPKEVSVEWCDRFVPRPTLEDVLAGAVGRTTRKLGYNTQGYYPRHGIGELTAAMGRRITRLHLNRNARRIFPKQRCCAFDDSHVNYDFLVSTLPLPELVSIIDQVPREVADAARLLRCSALYYLDVALRHPCRRDFHWIYVPEAHYPFYRVGNYAAFSQEMAPLGASSLYVELVGRSPPDLSLLWPSVARCLCEMGLITDDDVLFYRLRRIEHAYVIYDSHRASGLPMIQDYLDSIGIISTGRYGGWNYSSMEDALQFGEEAASEAANRLK